MTVNFMGLTGPLGVLPLYYTELVMERLRARDTGLRDFLDIFNHRAISLFYQAWEKYRLPIAYERWTAGGHFLEMLQSMVGLGTPGLANRQAVGDESLLYYAGLLGQQPRSASARSSFSATTSTSRSRWSSSWAPGAVWTGDADAVRDSEGFSTQLGFGAVVGDEVWDPQSRVRVKLGPLPLEQYLEFLPIRNGVCPAAGAMTRFFSGDDLDFEVQLILEREEVPSCVLGAEGEQAPRLGWATWVKSVPLDRDPADTVLHLVA